MERYFRQGTEMETLHNNLGKVVCPRFEVNPDDAWKRKGKMYKSVYANCMHCKHQDFGECKLEFYEFGEVLQDDDSGIRR